MNKAFQLILFFFFLVLLTPSHAQKKQKVIEGEFIHSVYFWLKNPDSQSDRESFEKSLLKFINSSEYIVSKHVGTPAGTPRDVVDNTYTYSLILTFKSKEDQDKYQEEEVHKQFIKESEHLWEKALIYDSINTL